MRDLNEVMDAAQQAVTKLEASVMARSIRESLPAAASTAEREEMLKDIAFCEGMRDDTSGALTWNDKVELGRVAKRAIARAFRIAGVPEDLRHMFDGMDF